MPSPQDAAYGAPPAYVDTRGFRPPPVEFQYSAPHSQQMVDPSHGYPVRGYPNNPSPGNGYPSGSPYAHVPSPNSFAQHGGYPPSQGQVFRPSPSPPSGSSDFQSDYMSGQSPYSRAEKQQPFPPLAEERYRGEGGSLRRGNMSNPPASSSSSFLDKMKSFAPGSSPAELLNPPPPSFQRSPSLNVPYGPFPSTTLLSVGSLDKGFPLVPPPATTNPHPFTLHDVNEEDWRNFLSHIKAASALSVTNRVVAQAAPLVLGIGFLPGLFVSKDMESHMKGKKNGAVSEIMDHWNHYFFHPRQVDVALTEGRTRLVGPDNSLQGDMAYRRNYRNDRDYSSDSSSGSSSDNGRRHRYGRKASRKAEKRERKAEKRAAKAERRYGNMRGRDSRDDQFMLVVSYRSPMGY